MEKQTALESNAEYEAFVNKFKPKLTTDDCYTPPEVYEVVKNWACAKYGIDPAKIVRPFYPGGDYESFVCHKLRRRHRGTDGTRTWSRGTRGCG